MYNYLNIFTLNPGSCLFVFDLHFTTLPCSAGIGRTGVLITMETAMCLIEANQPVYPLDIVRQMRDQRAMLIQTSVSTHAAIMSYLSYM